MTSQKDMIQGLRELLNEGFVLTDREQMAYAARDETPDLKPYWPMAVALPKNKEKLLEVVRYCAQNQIPITPRGAGTGKSGGALMAIPGIVLDLSKLNRIMDIDVANSIATLEPGVILGDLKREVLKKGLWYPIDPASEEMCTLGGCVAENASGPSTLKYGTTRDYVLGGEALLPTGELIRFGKKTRKGVTGYDIGSLLVGSEGTLAIFTEVTLRLIPKPPHELSALLTFQNNEEAAQAVGHILQSILPRAIEYMDERCLEVLQKRNSAGFLPADKQASLLVEVDGHTEEDTLLQIHKIAEILKGKGLITCFVAADSQKRQKLWTLRKSLSAACTEFLGKKRSEDVVVQLSFLPQFLRELYQLGETHHLFTCAFGHAGDGNVHVQILYRSEAQKDSVEEVIKQVFLLALKYGGTLSGEHGIGLSKKDYLPLEQSFALIELQKRLKSVFDPKHILNPGKMFP